MNQVGSWLQNIRSRLFIGIFWLVIALLISAAFGYGNPLAAQANPLTQERTSYQGNQSENAQTQDGIPNQELMEKSRQNLKSRADDIREKLNLDQPIYPGTKEVLDTAQHRAKEAVQGTQQALEKAVDGITGND